MASRATTTERKESGASKQQDQIVHAAKGKVEEELLGAAFGKPRGAMTAAVGGGVIASEIGARRAGKQAQGAESLGIELGTREPSP